MKITPALIRQWANSDKPVLDSIAAALTAVATLSKNTPAHPQLQALFSTPQGEVVPVTEVPE